MSFESVARVCAVVLAAATAACGSAPPQKPAQVPVSPTVVPALDGAPAFSERELLLLCGRQAPLSGGTTLAKVALEVEEGDKNVSLKSSELLKAPEAQCKDAADKLDNAFELSKAASRTLCDLGAARGFGIDGESLVAETSAVLTSVQAALTGMATGDAKACAKRSLEVTQQIATWLELRAARCAPNPAESALLECGVFAKGSAPRADAEAFCSAPTRDGHSTPAAQKVAKCVLAAQTSDRGITLQGSSVGSARGVGDLTTPSLETTLLRGTAEFFEARAKEEAKLFAFEVVKAHLCGDDQLKPFLSNTCALFNAEETLAPTPGAIREAVRADLDHLPEVLAGRIENHQLACATAVAWSFSEETAEGTDVLELLGNPDLVLGDPLVMSRCSEPIRREVRDIALKLEELLERDRAGVERMVKAGQFDRAVAGAANVRGPSGALNEYGQVLKAVMMRVRQLDSANAVWKRDASAANRAAVVVAGLRTFEPILGFALKKHTTDASHPNGDEKVLLSARLSLELAGKLVNRQYTQAVVTAATLGVAAGVENGRAQNLLGLAASLAQAESSDAVRATLEDAALPLGSWRRKNEPRVGATLTGMVGFQLAHEVVVQKTAAGGDVAAGLSFAPTLLIGADVHRGLGHGLRLGAQVSVLDLGALLSFRTKQPKVEPSADGEALESAEDTPELRVEQLLSPGIYPYLGWGPLDFGVGLSFVPALRGVTGPDGLEPLNVVRFGAFVAVDVSVLPLL